MINKSFFTILFILLILPFYSAVQIEMKENYDLGETLISKVSGNFLEPISKQDVYFYRRHMPTTIDFSIVKLKEDYYIYAQIPMEKVPDEYSIFISGVTYFQEGQIKEKDIFQNFSITNETAEFSVIPAALSVDKDFSLLVESLQDKTILISIFLLNETSSSGGFFSFLKKDSSKKISSFYLNSGKSMNVDFNIDDFEEGINFVRLDSENTSYIISINVIKEKEKPNFSFEKNKINVSVKTDTSESRSIFLHNSGKDSLKNISLFIPTFFEEYINLSKNFIEEIPAGAKEEVILTFYSEKEVSLEGFVKASYYEEETFLQVYFNSFSDYVPPKEDVSNETNETNDPVSEEVKTCSELEGVPCGEGKVCEGTLVSARDDRCCIGVCKNLSNSSLKKIIGWSIIIICVLVFSWFLLKKYSETRKSVSLPKFLKNK